MQFLHLLQESLQRSERTSCRDEGHLLCIPSPYQLDQGEKLGQSESFLHGRIECDPVTIWAVFPRYKLLKNVKR